MDSLTSTTELLSIIAGSDGKAPKYKLTCRITTPGGELTVYKVTSEHTLRNYADGTFAETRMLVVLVPPGEFEDIVYSYRDNITVEMIKSPVRLGSDIEDTDDGLQRIKRYRGVLTTLTSPRDEGNFQSDGSSETQDLKEIRAVGIQLMEPAVEQIKLLTTGGVFHNTTTPDLIRFLYGHLCKTISLDDDERVLGVTVADNTAVTNVVKQIIIPQATRLIDIPEYLQTKATGVYTTGISRYYQNQYWYIYPLYDVNNFANAPRKLTILNLPSNMMRNLDRTYRFIDDHLYIVSNMDTVGGDPSLGRLMNEGAGIRYANASALREGFGVTSDNKTIQSRQSNMTEYVIGRQQSGMEYSPLSDEPITVNDAHQRSKLAYRMGAFLQLGWEGSDPSLIVPGMSARVITPQGGRQQIRYATVIGCETNVTTDTNHPTNTTHTWRSAITLFIESKEEES